MTSVRRKRTDRHRIVNEPPSSAILIAKLWSISSRNSLRIASSANDPVATMCCSSWLIGSWRFTVKTVSPALIRRHRETIQNRGLRRSRHIDMIVTTYKSNSDRAYVGMRKAICASSDAQYLAKLSKGIVRIAGKIPISVMSRMPAKHPVMTKRSAKRRRLATLMIRSMPAF